MKTVFYKLAGFALSDDDLRILSTRIAQKVNKSHVANPESRLGIEMGRILTIGQNNRAILGIFSVYWPNDHPRAKFCDSQCQWLLVVRPEPSLTETLENFTQVPLVPDEEEEDKRAVEWLKQYGYSDEEIGNMWTSAPSQWIEGLDEYPLSY